MILVGPKLNVDIAKRVKLLKKRMKEAQDRQKYYANFKKRPPKFKKGDPILLKISSVSGVMRFEKSSKLNPMYVGPLDMLKREGKVAYPLTYIDLNI